MFRLLSLPGLSIAHYPFQRHVTRTWPRPSLLLDSLWERSGELIECYARHADAETAPRVIFEIGAGRDLAVPLSLRARGVDRVVTVDANRIARLDLVQHAAEHIRRRARAPIPDFRSWDSVRAFGIDYRAPQRAESCFDLLDTVDCIWSNEVLEHIPADRLRSMLSGTRELLRPGGLSIHHIDYSDHYARSDLTICRFNFLQYDDAQWKKYNSPLQYVSRLRHSDYIAAFKDSGYTIIEENSISGSPSDTVRSNLAPQFTRYDATDLYAVRGQIVARA